MKKKWILLVCFCLCVQFAMATHIIGGELFYAYQGPGATAGTSKYLVTLRLFRLCNQKCEGNTNVACMPESVVISAFTNNAGYARYKDYTLTHINTNNISLTTYPVCITNRPSVCYEVWTYTLSFDLPDNNEGYMLAYENCCRSGSENVVNNNPYAPGNPKLPGATYNCVMPGRNLLGTTHNSSAVFNIKDTALVCYDTKFVLDFSAVDPDVTDSVSYGFASAYTSGSRFPGNQDNTAAENPAYKNVAYNNGYAGDSPLGSGVTIDPVTGIISGVSPSTPGLYVVNVIAYEWRAGVNIGQHRKDFILRVEDCQVPKAILDPSYITCNGFDLTFQSNSSSPNIHSYFWDFGDPVTLADTSLKPIDKYVYKSAGTYIVKLVTNRGEECADSTYAVANVYPGFVPAFDIVGGCFQNPYKFIDKTTSVYGTVDSWAWDFGDASTRGDTSHLQNPQYTYNSAATRDIRLIVTNSRGCLDTLVQNVAITDKPAITLPFKDTLICNLDTLQLHASSAIPVSYTWTPVVTTLLSNTANPLVFPNKTTTYYIAIDDGEGCKNTDSVKVNVVDKAFLNLGKDTSICLTDDITFSPQTNALYFAWSPAQTIKDPKIKAAVATPKTATTYSLHASISKKCFADDDILVRTPPYPIADAGADSSVCFGFTTHLNGNYTGSTFAWLPQVSLLNSQTLTPIAGPQATQVYTLTVRDTDPLGCPKPVTDQVTVNVIPPLNVFAGNDTNIVINQALQMQATGAVTYHWSPATGMNNPDIANPVVTLGEGYTTMKYNVRGSTPEGCFDNDSITVYVYKTLPEIFVPSGFTPNGDGKNDVLRPIMAGIKKLEIFGVYNRWGQMLYSTSVNGEGWDGTVGGKKQPPGTYVYMANAIDYGGRPIQRKGSFVLIR